MARQQGWFAFLIALVISSCLLCINLPFQLGLDLRGGSQLTLEVQTLNPSNPVEIESYLFGINANNLVQPQPPVKPELHTIPEISFFNRLPIIMPKPLVVENKQRPLPIP